MNLEFLKLHAPFNQMQAADQKFLAEHLSESFFSGDSIVTGPEHGLADKLYIIKQGRIRGYSSKLASNDDSVWELTEGEIFPVGALLSHREVKTWHRAIEDTQCYELKRDDFEELLNKSSVFHDFCTRRLANLLEQAMLNMQANTATRVSEDSSLNTPLRDLLSPDPIACSPETSIETALEMIEAAQRRSIAVVDNKHRPIGIMTLRDVVVKVTLARIDIDTPVSQVMNPIKDFLEPDDFAYEAALIMAQRGFGHICVVEHDQFVGLLSERDLFSLQRVGLGNLSRAIQRSEDIETLQQLSRDLVLFTDQMMAQGASVIQIMRLITTLNDLITQRVIDICENKYGKPDIAYTWLAFGSEGRMEQTLKTDQDNGILFEANAKDADRIREQLLPLAKEINQALAQVGFPLCPGNIMASNPECCLSKEEWQDRFDKWISVGTPEHLLNASIFFDFRVLRGNEKAAYELHQWLDKKAKQNSQFRQKMAANALRNRPPLGLFKDFASSGNKDFPNAIDLKTHGITPFVDAARIFTLAGMGTETNTIARLKEAVTNKILRKDSVESWVEAYQYIQLLRMRKHRQQTKSGKELNNFLDPDELNELERRILKEAFRQARKIQTKLALDYQL